MTPEKRGARHRAPAGGPRTALGTKVSWRARRQVARLSGPATSFSALPLPQDTTRRRQKGLLSDLPKVPERAVTKQLKSAIPLPACGRQDSPLVGCSGLSRVRPASANIGQRCLVRRYQRRGKVECCRLIRVQSCVLISAYMRNTLPLSPPAGVRKGVMLHPARLEFSERLLEERHMPIKPAGQHLTPAVFVKGSCVFAYVVKQAL